MEKNKTVQTGGKDDGKTSPHQTKSLLKKIAQQKWLLFIMVLVLAVFIVFGIPLIINELYKSNTGYKTLWGASDVLAFYAEILGGVITIIALMVTINYTKKDTEKQIKLSKTQINTPFFVIDTIQQNDNKFFDKIDNEQRWKNEYVLNSYGNSQTQAIIKLKNIGDGIAISPSYEIGTSLTKSITNINVICKDEFFILNYNIEKTISNMVHENSKSFNTFITLKYQNTLGMKFEQRISLQHIYCSDTNSLLLIINNVTPQTIEI